MAGDPSKASIWADADVWVAPLTAANPVDVLHPFDGDWDLVGLLDGSAGFVYHRDEKVDDHFAWGGIIVRTARRNFKQSVHFTALEDNDVTLELLWPGSTTTQLIVPRPKRMKVAFETTEDAKVKRMISHYQAEIMVNKDFVDQEDNLTTYEFMATLFPAANGTIFDRQETAPVS